MDKVRKILYKLTTDEKWLIRINAVMLALLIAFSVFSYIGPYDKLGFDRHAYVSLTTGWTQVLPDGDERAIVSVPARLNDQIGEEIVIRRRLPESFPASGCVLFVRSAHQNLAVRVDGREIYRYEFQSSRVQDANFPPSQWLVIPLDDGCAGKAIELSLTRLQDDGTDTVSSIYLGDKSDIIFHLVRRNVFPLICSAVILLVGAAFVTRQVLSPSQWELGRRNLYTGANLILMALWMLCNSEIRQVFFQNIVFFRNMEFMTLMLLPFPVLLSLNYSEGGKFYKTAYRLCAAILLTDFVIIALVLSGKRNFLDLLWLLLLTVAAAGVFVLISFWQIGVTDKELFHSLRSTFISYGLLVAFGALEYLDMVLLADRYKGVCLSLGLVCYTVGLTIEQFRTQRSLVAQVQRSEMESRAKTDFLANVSHEIRTPINAVLGMNEMILREATNPAVLSYATDIRHAGNHLLTIINDILDLSRIESGRMEISEYDYDLPVLLEEIIDLIQTGAEEKGLKFKATIQSVLPNKLRGDAARIRQIAVNLLNNAVKYTKRGRVVFVVDTISTEEEAVLRAKAVVKGEATAIEAPIYLCMRIRDTGIGIRKEDFPKLFENFERLDEERNAGIQGTGLGLSIVSMLVQLMHGCLLVESVYEVGTQFTVVIPQEKVSGEWFGAFGQRREEVRDARREETLFTAPDAAVLAVDDNAMNLRLLEAMLRRTKVKLVACGSGEECLRLARGEHFDLILMDHLMPGMDGIETLHRLKTLPGNRCAGVPVVVLTANAVSGAREQYLAEGFTDYLSKPVQSGELEQLMVRYLPADKVLGASEQAGASDAAAVSILPDWLYDVKELDIAQGVKFCATEDIYLETLAIFAANAFSTADEIEALRDAGDTADVVVKVHALKSTSRAIGAETLAALAEKLEAAGKADDTQTLEEGLDGLLARCRLLGRHLDKLVETKPAEDERELPAISKEQLRETYERIRALTEEFEYDRAASMIDSLGGCRLPEGERERCEKLKQAADAFDWDKIGEILGQ